MRKKIKQSPKLPAETRRDQLLKSAHKLFVRKGFRATTTEEIARAAGLTKGALYFHFENKEDILFALVKSIAGEYDRMIKTNMKPPISPRDFFRLLLDVHTQGDLPEYWDVVDIWVQAMRIPRIKRFIARRLGAAVETFAGNVDPAYGGSRKKMAELGVLTLALCDGLCVLKMMDPALVDLEAQVELFARLFEGNIKSPKARIR